jgi:hypothetical protein
MVYSIETDPALVILRIALQTLLKSASLELDVFDETQESAAFPNSISERFAYHDYGLVLDDIYAHTSCNPIILVVSY